MCISSHESDESVECDRLSTLKECLRGAYDCLLSLGPDYSENCTDLNQLSDRLDAGQFRLAVLGQFKRGKSTLLNALLGEDLLPTDILPVTAIPTFIVHAGELSASVVFADDQPSISFRAEEDGSLDEFLKKYVTEAGNPNNRHGVSRVEIGHPAELLRQGVVLIDTPGVGSTHKHNTEVAYQILPQCDAALFLVSPDPPITEAELEYLKEICRQLPRTFYLLNKVDFLDDADQITSLKFLADQLTPLLDGVPQILPISARNGLKARLNGDAESWKSSGMEQVDQNLIDFFAREKQQTLQSSISNKMNNLLNQAVMQVQLSLKALALPEEELNQRIELFRRTLPDIEREKLAARDMLDGDLKRLEAELSSEVESIRERAKDQILPGLDSLFQTVAETEELERQVHDQLADRLPRFFANEMAAISGLIQERGTSLLNIHQQRSDELIEKVRRNAADLFDIPYRSPSASETYTSFTAPGWSYDLFISDMDPLGQKLSRKLFSRKFRHRRTIARLKESSRKLIGQNVEQINWALRRGVDESFRQFGAGLSDQLDKTIVAIRSAMEIALRKSESRSCEIAAQELALRKALEEMKRLIGAHQI